MGNHLQDTFTWTLSRQLWQQFFTVYGLAMVRSRLQTDSVVPEFIEVINWVLELLSSFRIQLFSPSKI